MSFRKIDYRVRPAKSIERKMLAETLKRLYEFGDLSAYQYVGFGSLFFADFSLFHRSLGIDRMISIEDVSDPKVKDRFRFNVPLGYIDLRYGNSNVELPKIDWMSRSIVWMDYDGTISPGVLKDVEFLIRNVPQGSVVIFSVNASSIPSLEEEEDSAKLTPVERLKKVLGADAIPYELKSSDLAGWGVARAYRDILNGCIQSALKVRNSALPSSAHMDYKQLFNFHYSDNAKMVTVGGVIFDAGQKAIVAKCGFEGLPFVRTSEAEFLIETPNLTFREMRELDSKLPGETTEIPVPASDVEKYKKTYRFFPRFVEAELT